MLGIGGVSMSGIAEILKNWGFTVTGTDANDSEIIHKLQNTGIKVTIGHNFDDLRKADLLVYSAAISPEDPEMQEATRQNIPKMERADFVGMITAAFGNTIGVSGTHGKTTTTSMISLCFLRAMLDPTIQVGAILKQIDGNYKVGNSEYFILEACEYVESFLKFSPKSEIVLNIDNDHLDYFKTLERIKNAFIQYVKLLPKDGLLVINGDDANCLDLVHHTKANIYTYGIQNQTADFIAKNITFDDNGFAHFDVFYQNAFYQAIQLHVAGIHNVLNALACIALCHHYGIQKEIISNALSEFTGANRRFEYKGKFQGVSVYDDYAHHPTEILATYQALKNKPHHETWVIFQPHTYSRTKNLLSEFVSSLSGFDHIIITDIYAAREKNTYGVSSLDLVNKLRKSGKTVEYISDFKDIVAFVKKNVQSSDILLTLGAGTVTQIGPMLVGGRKLDVRNNKLKSSPNFDII